MSQEKEQLRNLLNDFLDQLIASKPPAPASMVQQPENKEEQQPEEGKRIPTPEELSQGYLLGGEQTLRRDAGEHAGRERGRRVTRPTPKSEEGQTEHESDVLVVDPKCGRR